MVRKGSIKVIVLDFPMVDMRRVEWHKFQLRLQYFLYLDSVLAGTSKVARDIDSCCKQMRV